MGENALEVLGSGKSVALEFEDKPAISILLPAYNEADIISKIIRLIMMRFAGSCLRCLLLLRMVVLMEPGRF
ncbi:MAG: hypothetical protein OEZ40_02705 [Candidatus Bathyarchaeota archaeon]|nr:hypothetical protein [Candidatus Bathyarchaeota archaeon]